MKFIMTCAGHARGGDYLVLPYFGIPAYWVGTPKLDKKLLQVLDGLECFIPATLANDPNSTPKKLPSYMRLSVSLVKKLGKDFRFHASHACYEDPRKPLESTAFNLAEDRDTDEVCSELEWQAGIASIVANTPSKPGIEKAEKIKPIFNMHLGKVQRRDHKYEAIQRVTKVLKRAVQNLSMSHTLCIENMDPAKDGHYNLGQEAEDLDIILANVPGLYLTYDTSHADATCYRQKKIHRKLPRSEEEIAEAFYSCHRTFQSRFDERIAYMHFSFNDVFFNGNSNGYYGIDRHGPLTKAKQYPTFYEEAFKPAMQDAFKILESNTGNKAVVNLEIPRKKILGKIVAESGGTLDEQIDSVHIAREINSTKNEKHPAYRRPTYSPSKIPSLVGK